MRKSSAALGSAVFFLVTPATVAGLVPWLLTSWRSGWSLPAAIVVGCRVIGAILVVVGTVVLLDAFVRFVAEGAGTPAPVAPTAQLVVGGFYRYVRNPMYLAVLSAIVGQALILGRLVLVLYAAVVAALVFAFVRWHEEPALLRKFGAGYRSYQAAVPGGGRAPAVGEPEMALSVLSPPRIEQR